MTVFKLRARLTDGFVVNIDQPYYSQASADRAAGVYIRDYSDPCGLGVSVESVAVIKIEE